MAVDTILTILWELVLRFGEIISAPIKNPELLWVIIPIYVSWITTDFFQEKHGTPYGNALTNGIVSLWVSVEWIRTILNLGASFNVLTLLKLIIVTSFLIYGVIIIIEAYRGKSIVKYIGRKREVSYLMICFTPILYEIVPPDLRTIGATLLFLPIFYGIFELVDRVLPDPFEGSDSRNTSSDLSPSSTSSELPSYEPASPTTDNFSLNTPSAGTPTYPTSSPSPVPDTQPAKYEPEF